MVLKEINLHKIDSGIITKVNRTRAVVKVYLKDKNWAKYNVPFTMITKEVSNG